MLYVYVNKSPSLPSVPGEFDDRRDFHSAQVRARLLRPYSSCRDPGKFLPRRKLRRHVDVHLRVACVVRVLHT